MAFLRLDATESSSVLTLELGVWKRIMDALVARGYSMDVVDLDSLSIDSDTVPAEKGALVGFDGHKRVKGTKVHVAVTEESLPIAVSISSGRIHEGTRLIPPMESSSIETEQRPEEQTEDRPRRHQGRRYQTLSNKKRRPGRPRPLDKEAYHGVRYNVERFFGWLENYRKITIRYERMP